MGVLSARVYLHNTRPSCQGATREQLDNFLTQREPRQEQFGPATLRWQLQDRHAVTINTVATSPNKTVVEQNTMSGVRDGDGDGDVTVSTLKTFATDSNNSLCQRIPTLLLYQFRGVHCFVAIAVPVPAASFPVQSCLHSQQPQRMSMFNYQLTLNHTLYAHINELSR